MKVIDLVPEHEELYFCCLEDWSEEMKEAGDHKESWFRKMKDRGLRVKLALDDAGHVGGMVQYVPIEQSTAEGQGLYFINCIWVHGYERGRGNFQKKGMGKALLQAAEEDVKGLGASGMAAWGLLLPFWMKASWFRKQGYHGADRMGMQSLLWKPFAQEAAKPRWIRQRKTPALLLGKVVVTAFINGWCPGQNIVFERARRAAAEVGDKVVFQPVYTADRETFLEWGISDALYIDGKGVRTGPPPSFAKVKGLIEKRARRL